VLSWAPVHALKFQLGFLAFICNSYSCCECIIYTPASTGKSLIQIMTITLKVCTWSSLIYCFFSVQGKVERWQKAYQLRIPSPPMSPHGPPQGNGPPHQVPLGVNMIVWSLDTCFILAAIVGEDFLACTMKCHKDCMIS